VTISTLVDTNILIDLLSPADAPMRDWSVRNLKSCHADGSIVFSPIVWAELADPRLREVDLLQVFAWLRPRREDLPFAAATAAGEAHRLYRRRGGGRERTLPDFLIGAHASVAGHRLLTRDAARYRGYFPELDLICPETHP